MILHADAKNFFDTFFVSAEKTYYIFDRGPTSDQDVIFAFDCLFDGLEALLSLNSVLRNNTET